MRDKLLSLSKIPDITFKSTGKLYQASINAEQRMFHNVKNDDGELMKWRAVQAAVGCGKTAMATIEVIRHCYSFRNNFGFIVRESLPQQQISSIPDFEEVCPSWMILRWNSQDKVMRILNKHGHEWLKSGKSKGMGPTKRFQYIKEIGGYSTIVFTSFQGTTKALRKWRSSNIGFVFIDQAEEANEKVQKAFARRLRRENSARQAWFIANFLEEEPPEEGWLWRFFCDESPEKRKNHWYFDKMPTVGNKANLTDDYFEGIENTHSKDEIAQYLEGDRSQMKMTLSVFSEMSRQDHVIPHKEPESHWLKGVGMDTGINNPTAFVEVAFLPTGDVYVYNEFEQTDKILSDLATQLYMLKTPQHVHWQIDATANNRNQVTGTSLREELASFGFPFELAPREVGPGVMKMKEYLRVDPKHQNPFTGIKGAPRLYISERCVRLWSSMSLFRVDENKTHTTKQNQTEKFRQYKDHLTDALRFILAGVLMPLGMKDGKAPKLPVEQPSYPDGIPGTTVAKNPVQIPAYLAKIHGETPGTFNFASVMAVAKQPVRRASQPSRPRTQYWSGRGVVG